jgi:hypothetical protein
MTKSKYKHKSVKAGGEHGKKAQKIKDRLNGDGCPTFG